MKKPINSRPQQTTRRRDKLVPALDHIHNPFSRDDCVACSSRVAHRTTMHAPCRLHRLIHHEIRRQDRRFPCRIFAKLNTLKKCIPPSTTSTNPTYVLKNSIASCIPLGLSPYFNASVTYPMLIR